jgi:acetoacetyl-CoA synthetase
VPDRVYAVPSIPRTLNGKKLEVPVQRILAGEPPEKVANPGAMANPKSLDYFVELAHERGRRI